MNVNVTEKIVTPQNYFRTVLSGDSTEDDYDQFIYSLEVGSVFFFENIDYETIRYRVTKKYLPDTLQIFDIAYVSPGTILYSLNGPDCCVVTVKQKK